MPFHPAPPLPARIAALLPFPRINYELTRGRHAGLELHVLDAGPRDAEAVFLVHGNPTWSLLWRKVMLGLPHRRCVAPDLLGFGLSSKPKRIEEHSVDGHADALCELIEALQLRRVLLVGQDWGGPLCAAIGARMPERVRGLVLGNTAVLVPERPRGTWFHRFARMRGVSEVAFIGLGLPQRAMWTMQHDRGSIGGRLAAAYRWPLRRLVDRIGPLALARMVPDDLRHPSIDALRRGQRWVEGFEGPMALVWGTNDPILGGALPRHRAAFPRAAVTVTEAGHFLQEEVPDILAAAIDGVWRRGESAMP
jgi:cis-3-alkyl-4-acyloxetan-2-one decarboxylase